MSRSCATTGRSAVAVACICTLALALSAASASAAYEVSPTAGAGSVTATGTTSIGVAYTATLTASFTPAHIQPGEPFTYTAQTVADEPDGGGSGCTPGSNSQVTPSDSWFFLKVGPGEDFYTEGSAATAPVAASFTNTETFDYICPALRFTTGPMTVPVSGEQSQALEPGCYQSTVFENGIYFPDGGPSALAQVASLTGTVATLQVGHGLDCAKPGAGAQPLKDVAKFAADGTAKLNLACEQLASPCEGKAVIKTKQEQHGRVPYPGCKHCTKVATGKYSIAAGTSGPATLKLTKLGARLLKRGGCKHCGKLATAKGRVPYPGCKRCGKISADLVLTSAATGLSTTSPISARGGRCKNCN